MEFHCHEKDNDDERGKKEMEMERGMKWLNEQYQPFLLSFTVRDFETYPKFLFMKQASLYNAM